MWSGSHKDNLKDHDQMFYEGNLLTRGQTVNNVPKKNLKSLILTAGQMSLHHPKVVHGSELNKSNDRRIGFVIQSYIGTNVKQILGKNSVQLARGIDDYNFHKKIGRPKSLSMFLLIAFLSIATLRASLTSLACSMSDIPAGLSVSVYLTLSG